MNEPQVCVRCLMDTTDPDIQFDTQGVCSHCKAFAVTEKEWNLPQVLREGRLEETFTKIKSEGAGREWDCIMGVSGGVDSSYVAHLAKKFGLRPLCVHLDNGWNSELATANIHRIVSKLGYELFTHVIDWQEFRDMQRSFFKANVVDIEMLSDHAIFGVILQLARRHNIKYILSGANISTEAIMPKSWVHRKSDRKNIQDIQQRFGTRKIKTFPYVSTLEHVFYMYGLGYKVLKPLNLMDYNKAQAKELLKNELGWRDYGGKHYESVFTKFYQAHILPVKFNIDKRKAHLSTLINSHQMLRPEAAAELAKPLYDPQELKNDTEYVCKKLGFSNAEWQAYLQAPPVPHAAYATDETTYRLLDFVRNKIAGKKSATKSRV